MGKKTRKQRVTATTAAEKPPATSQLQQQHLKLDPRGDGMYSGTFRWLESKTFPPLPPFPARGNDNPPVDLTGEWQGYLTSRGSSAADGGLVATVTRDPSCLDALSFPVTFLHGTQLLGLCRGSELRVLVIGASQKAEQRVWRTTDYWSEIAAFYAETQVTLYFIGPEVREHDDDRDKSRTSALPLNMTVCHFRGTFGDFQDSQLFSDCTPETSVIVGYNTGFGNFIDSQHHDLLFSWLPDLYRIAESGIPAIFTCANDYADMSGEFAVQSRVIGARMLLLPKQNPFSAASHLHEEGQRDTAWSRGSSFLYATHGFDKDRRVDIACGDVAALQKRLDVDLDMHLQDECGRHFYKGMVLTKEQASRCKALNGSQLKVPQPTKAVVSSVNDAQLGEVESPRFELIPGRQQNEIVAVVLVPRVTSAAERIKVNLVASILTIDVPGKYLLQTKLPFQVDENASVPTVELALPLLRVSFRRK